MQLRNTLILVCSSMHNPCLQPIYLRYSILIKVSDLLNHQGEHKRELKLEFIRNKIFVSGLMSLVSFNPTSHYQSVNVRP